MGSGSCPCSSFVLEVTEEMINNKEIVISGYKTHEDLEELARSNGVGKVRIGKTRFESEFLLYDKEGGDIYDGLKDGKIYMTFGIDDLYDRKKSKLGKMLTRKKMFPKYERWTVYG